MAKYDCNKKNGLGLQERMLLLRITGPQEKLDYPTEILKMSNGCEVERYVIPDEDKEKVFDALYPFIGRPSLEDTLIDVHTSKTFKVRDYMVVREGDGNFLVSPYYAEAGGTVLDWMDPAHNGG
ncbi:MAG: hypothetical protein IJS15_11610 [Victivallales bacterium]|nr:hypothetical protein [Victivallales bacterium]